MSRKTLIILNLIQVSIIFFILGFNHKKPLKHEEVAEPPFTPILQLPQTPISPQVPDKLTVEQAKETITVKDSKDILNYLASDELEGRMSGKKGNKTAADYIKKRFDSFGLKTYYQKFPISRLNPGPNNETGDDFTNNIIAVLEGQQQDCIVVGAHMDHIGYGPSMSRDGGGKIHNGADDNGSGSTVVLEISEAMSKLSKPSYTYVFICFSAEEMGLIGSQYYVRNPIIPNKIKMMINFDMVGWYKGKTCMINGGSKINPIKTALESLRPKYTNLKYSLTNSTGGGSDHVPFSNAGIPSVFFFTGLTPVYHTANDDVDQIDFDGLTTIARLAFEMLTEVDKMPKKVINSTTYEKTDYPMIHDHGIGVEFPHNHDHNHKH